MPSKSIKLFIIAGEASGDMLGSKLIKELKIKLQQIGYEEIIFVGVGGKLMCDEGLATIFPMDDLSVMGFAEVVPHIPKLLFRIRQTANKIIEEAPDFVITIDSPDFCFRVVKKLMARINYDSGISDRLIKLKKVHMIAPSVWAYRQGRAKKVAKLYNLLLAILPFEPPYFEKYGLKTVFIGNPAIEKYPDFTKTSEIRLRLSSKFGFLIDDLLIYVTPGSRNGEVKRIFPEFIGALNRFHDQNPNIKVMIALTSKTKKIVQNLSQQLSCKYYFVEDQDKIDALFIADFALAKSGTNTLEIALHRVPMIIAYKVNFITYLLAKILLRVKFANLINLIANKEIIPEMIQKNCTADKIFAKLQDLINDKNLIKQQLIDSQSSLAILGLGSKNSASSKAADEIIKLL